MRGGCAPVDSTTTATAKRLKLKAQGREALMCNAFGVKNPRHSVAGGYQDRVRTKLTPSFNFPTAEPAVVQARRPACRRRRAALRRRRTPPIGDGVATRGRTTARALADATIA